MQDVPINYRIIRDHGLINLRKFQREYLLNQPSSPYGPARISLPSCYLVNTLNT